MTVAYQRVIMERFMSESELKNFEEEYNGNRLKSHTRTPDATDRGMFGDYRGGMSERAIASKYRVSMSKVRDGIKRVALSKL